MPDFIGGDPESNASECPAVFVIPETGDFVFRGKTITDPALIAEFNEHIGKAEDESDVWLPARMAPLIRDALDGYEQGRQGPGQHTFAELLAATQASVIRFEMRDSYDETEQGFAEWKATGDLGAYDWGDHLDVIRTAVARGVTIRRVRVVSEHRVVRWNFQRGDGTNPRRYTFSSDPRTVRDIVAAFELAWNRATPHADYKPD